MPTWFVGLQNGERTGRVAALASTAEEALERVGLPQGVTTTEVTPLDSHPACLACPSGARCDASVWANHRYGDDRFDPKELNTSVHTCKSCFRKVVSFNYGFEESAEVPDNCPRWDALSGSASDCATCYQEREALRKAHPSYVSRMEASHEMINMIFAGVKRKQELPEGVESLDTKREIHENSVKYVEHTMPFRHVTPTEDELLKAARLVERLMDIAMQEPEFQREIASNTTWDTSLQPLEWADNLVLSIRRHGSDVPKIIRDWTLLYADRPPWCRAWVRVSVARRRLILRVWEGAARSILTPPAEEGQPDQPQGPQGS